MSKIILKMVINFRLKFEAITQRFNSKLILGYEQIKETTL